MSNIFTEFMQSPTGRHLLLCIERSDVSLRSIADNLERIAESLEKIANPLIAAPLIATPLISAPNNTEADALEKLRLKLVYDDQEKPVEYETYIDPTDGITKTRPRW